ncbi:MAG: peptide ABC transporter substrate-binding protein [Acidimicrobiales bacterium]
MTLGVAACSSSKSDTATTDTSTASAEVPTGGTLIDGAQLQADNLTSYDPGQVQTLDESQVTTALYDGLTEFDYSDKQNPVLKGQVASKWESNANATEFTFTIKPGQQFSNGDPVLPSSFKYAWNRNGQADFASPYGYLINYVKGGKALQDGTITDLGDAIVADDTAMTLKVTLEAPQADFPAIVSHPFFGPLPEKVVSQLTDQTQWNKMIMIGNGPFKMEAPANEQQVVLVRNDKWAGDVYGNTSAKLDKIIFKISKDVQSGYTDFESGNVDTATIPPGQFGPAQQNYGNTVKSPTLGAYFFDFGFTDPQIAGDKNVLLRQAISQAIDREQINNKVYEGTRNLSTGVTPPGIPGFKADICKYCSFDQAAAQKAFDDWKAAGNSLSGPITIDFNTGAGHEDVVAIVQDNLKAIGIDTKTNPVSQKYFGTMAAGGCHVCRAGWYADYPTYGNFMFDLYSTASVGGNNNGSFSDPKFDDLVNQAQAQPDDTKRAELYQQAEDYLLNTAIATVPINWYTGDQVYNKDKVVNYDQPPLGIIQWQLVGVKTS